MCNEIRYKHDIRKKRLEEAEEQLINLKYKVMENN